MTPRNKGFHTTNKKMDTAMALAILVPVVLVGLIVMCGKRKSRGRVGRCDLLAALAENAEGLAVRRGAAHEGDVVRAGGRGGALLRGWLRHGEGNLAGR